MQLLEKDNEGNVPPLPNRVTTPILSMTHLSAMDLDLEDKIMIVGDRKTDKLAHNYYLNWDKGTDHGQSQRMDYAISLETKKAVNDRITKTRAIKY